MPEHLTHLFRSYTNVKNIEKLTIVFHSFNYKMLISFQRTHLLKHKTHFIRKKNNLIYAFEIFSNSKAIKPQSNFNLAICLTIVRNDRKRLERKGRNTFQYYPIMFC